MHHRTRNRVVRGVLSLLMGVALLVLALAPTVSAEDGVILSPDSKWYGATYGQWGARWWQWAFSLPVSENPLFDETGAMASNGQSGPVFFLAGVFNVSGTAERTITLTDDKALFFPILNYEVDEVGLHPALGVKQLYEWAAELLAAITELHASIDEEPVENLFDYRGTSRPYPFWLPETDNIYQYFGYDVSGTLAPAVSDGYWLMLAPLSVGEHEINFGGSLPWFTLEITYHITVVPAEE